MVWDDKAAGGVTAPAALHGPLAHVIHTMGWPLRTGKRFREFGGSFIYPMGEEMVSLGFVAGLESRDVEFSVHDVLQELKPDYPPIDPDVPAGLRVT